MKGLKNKMSIKAFCKRGLAVMLACAMVATSLPALNVRADETTDAAAETTLENFASTNEAQAILMKNAKANSEQWPAAWINDGKAEWAFDGDSSHWWHSRYDNRDQKAEHEVDSGAPTETNPIWIQSGFDKVWAVKEVHYAPRGNSHNIIGNYMIQLACLATPTDTPSDSDFVTVKTGTMLNQNAEQTIDLGGYYRATHVRLVALSKQGGGSDEITAKLISFYGMDIDSAATIDGITYDFTEAKDMYKQGEELDATGICHTESYSDGTISIPISGATYDSTGYDANSLGEQTVTVTYEGFSDTYNVSVVEMKQFSDTTALTKYAKANSEQNPVNGTDGTADWAFDGDSSHWWHSRYQGTAAAHEVSSGAASNTNPIWIQTGFGKPWDVREVHYAPRGNGNNVIGNYEVQIANMSNPLATPSDDDFVTVQTGLLVHQNEEQTIDLGRFYRATHVRLVALSALSNTGSEYITAKQISFYGVDAVIENPEEVAIMITTEPTKTLYYTGEELDTTGLEVIKVSNDGTTEIVTDYQVAGFNTNTAGTQTITVTSGEFTATYEVTMIETGSAVDARYDYDVTKMTYTAGSEYTGNDGTTGDGRIAWAFDNNLSTRWHSAYDAEWSDEAGTTREDYLWVEMTFEEPTVVDAIRYLPRNGNGDITGYKILGTVDGEEWIELTTGTWSSRTDWNIAEFTAMKLKALKLVATESVGDFACAVEIRVRTRAIDESIELSIEEEYTEDITVDAVVLSSNDEIATAENIVEVVGTKIQLYDHISNTSSSLNSFSTTVNDSIDLKDAEVELTNVEGNIYKAYNSATGKYVVKTGEAYVELADNADSSANQLKLQPTTAEDGTVTYRLCRASDSARYAIFYNTNMDFNTNDEYNASWAEGSYELVLLEKQEAESDADIIPGYTRATTITSGKTYLITYIWTDGSVLVLYPNVSSTAGQTKLVGDKVDITENKLKIKGVTVGTTVVAAGDVVYEVVVTEPPIVVTAGSVRRTDNDIQADGKPEKDPCRIIDGDKGNNWLSDPADSLADSWVNFELPKAKIVDGLKLYYGDANYIHKAYEVLVSTDGQNWTKVCEGTFANTAGEKTIKFKPVEAKHVRLVPTDKYGQELAIWEAEILYSDVAAEEWFLGGSLRMDYADDYDKTCLRFMYAFPETMAGLEAKTWFWNYGLNDNVSNTREVEAGKWGVKDGLINSNIVFTNVGRDNYDTPVYTQLTITYSDASGANTLTVYDTVVAERSVNDVAGAIENAYKDSVDEREVKQYNYALGILGKTASAQ